ncbi:hypothetical protein [Pleionea litopenaei]|uniref:Uncharacterized protein n=1 Tax=Pleionea litopenaei TaxID=3070815 RepID=A0AA51RWF2_9GAMM|nr:hypothetical protein [Pleionea sp. HL-JVS1]WMS88847.1 hypothetical protein Q9312_07985 [Pleionea sp. HL-JVS1]
MQWSQVHPFIEGHPEDLLEVYFEPMSRMKWQRLFDWLVPHALRVENQFGVIEPTELNSKFFLDQTMSYVIDLKTANDIAVSLSLTERDFLLLEVSLSELSHEFQFTDFINYVTEMANRLSVDKYSICREFNRQNPFIINGVLV